MFECGLQTEKRISYLTLHGVRRSNYDHTLFQAPVDDRGISFALALLFGRYAFPNDIDDIYHEYPAYISSDCTVVQAMFRNAGEQALADLILR